MIQSSQSPQMHCHLFMENKVKLYDFKREVFSHLTTLFSRPLFLFQEVSFFRETFYKKCMQVIVAVYP